MDSKKTAKIDPDSLRLSPNMERSIRNQLSRGRHPTFKVTARQDEFIKYAGIALDVAARYARAPARDPELLKRISKSLADLKRDVSQLESYQRALIDLAAENAVRAGFAMKGLEQASAGSKKSMLWRVTAGTGKDAYSSHFILDRFEAECALLTKITKDSSQEMQSHINNYARTEEAVRILICLLANVWRSCFRKEPSHSAAGYFAKIVNEVLVNCEIDGIGGTALKNIMKSQSPLAQ